MNEEYGHKNIQGVDKMVMTDAWMTIMRNVLYGDSVTMPTHVAIGTGVVAVSGSDIAMENELFRNIIDTRTKPGSAKVMFQGTLSAAHGNGTTFNRVGMFNAASGTTMVNHLSHTGILKADTFELRYQTEIENKDA